VTARRRVGGAGPIVVAAVVAALAAGLAACGAQQKPAPVMPPHAADAGAQPTAADAGMGSMTARPDDVRAEIRRLDADISTRLDAGGVGVPTEAAVAAARAISMDAAKAVCTPAEPTPTACADACTLGDAICDDAGRICKLADQLPGDTWAADRCAAGKASCETARQRCCDCR